MFKFYGDSIDRINVQYLLQATPFCKNSKINFSNQLTAKEFFDNMYTESINEEDSDISRENRKFKKKITDALKYTDNDFSKVDLIHIAGYGGCGKTTFVRHLLWDLYGDVATNGFIWDFEGEKSISDAYIDGLSKKIFFEFKKNNNAINLFQQITKFNLKRFSEILTQLKKFIVELAKLSCLTRQQLSQEQIELLLIEQKTQFQDHNSFVYFLIVLDFLWELTIHIFTCEEKPFVMVFDNVDSLSDLSEEHLFVSVLKNFINDCNFFFGNNLNNEKEYFGKRVLDAVKKIRFISFLTTRIVTSKRILELEPDLERVYGWTSLKMPENFYNHKDIISRRVAYYNKLEEGHKTKALEDLNIIERFSSNVNHNHIFKRLFNGNIRYCIFSLCNIISEYYSTGLIVEANALYEIKSAGTESTTGAIGIILSLLLNYFKDNNVYSEKLQLSECQPDNEISLSRVILTIIREKDGSCSLLNLLHLLYPLFSVEEICRTVYSLSESKRDIWRRLITFSEKYPKSVDDIMSQGFLFQNGIFDINQYSDIDICASGEEYLDYVVPHFEFMLSRHKYVYNCLANYNYQPLFSEGSEEIVGTVNSEIKYRFERKIDWVFKDVEDCCQNSIFFSQKIMHQFKMDEKSFLNNSFFNYHSINRDGTAGFRQSYGSRLIFSHIGYIERYRRFLLQKYAKKDNLIRQDFNARLVLRIEKYIKLYLDKKVCLQTSSQNEAASSLIKQIDKIKNCNYLDFETKIEI